MGGLLAGAVVDLLLHYVITPFLGFLGGALAWVANGSLAIAQQPWVASATNVSTAVAGSLLGLYVAYQALTQYVLWNEGTPDADGTTIWKGVLRVGLYGAFGTALAYGVFKFGILYGAALVASPVHAAVNLFATVANSIGGMSAVEALVLLLMFVILIIAFIVVVLQMFVRAAELTIYVVAAPLMALGQMNRDGGVWATWWRNLVVLSMATPVQWFAIKGLVATAVTSMLGTPGGAFIAILEMLAWVWVAVRGPHMIQQWSYRTGIGGGINYAGGQAVRLITRTK